MKRVTLFITMVLLLAFGAESTSAQSGYDLYQKALVKERAVGNVEEALRLYQQIVKEFSSNHALAAKAQLRLGLLYERLRRKAEAQRAFQACEVCSSPRPTPSVPRFDHLRPIVGREDEDGVLLHAELVHCVKQLSRVGIHLCQGIDRFWLEDLK